MKIVFDNQVSIADTFILILLDDEVVVNFTSLGGRVFSGAKYGTTIILSSLRALQSLRIYI